MEETTCTRAKPLCPSEKKSPGESISIPDCTLSDALIAKILSYTVETTRDLASLRRVSKAWYSSALPLVLRSGVVLDSFKYNDGWDFSLDLGREYTIEYNEDKCVWRSDDFLDMNEFLNKYEKKPVREGVAFVDGMVPNDLHDALMKAINTFAKKNEIDYHPNSNNILRDIVHPSLYPFVDGISPTTKSILDIPPVTSVLGGGEDYSFHDKTKDYWGRPYEASQFQLLPTYFDIGVDGNCKICDYINNLLPRAENEMLYSLLADLFSYALPLFESVLTYGRTIRPLLCDCTYDNDDMEHASLRGTRLQVITKIVDYELAPGETYEGVWHVEGMSHEEIVATALYYIDKDEDIKGGDILFKRAFNQREQNLMENVFNGQDNRSSQMDTILRDGLIPLGQVKTIPRRLLVFPNSHVHKVTKIENVKAEDNTDRKPKRAKKDHDVIREPRAEPGQAEDGTTCDHGLTNDNEENDNGHKPDQVKIEDAPARAGNKQKRRVIVFFLINPSRRIVSTREVPIQQEPIGSMSREDAVKYQLDLMRERKYAKQNWNVREIHLCEH